MIKETNNTIEKKEKPAPFIAFGSTEPILKKEVEKRKRIIERAEKLGINVTSLDMEQEYENPYKVEALVYIINDQVVPKELIEKIQEFEEKHKSDIDYEVQK